MKPNTKLVFTESPASNTFEMQDIPAIAKAAHAGGAIVVMDNTWATPLYFRALDHGVDVTVHASTKYPAGHSDLLLGTVSANAACWPQLNETLPDARRLRRPRRRLPGAARPAHDGRQARTPPGERARDRALAGRQAGRRARAAPGAGEPSRPRHLEARFLRRRAASSRSCSTAAARQQAHAFLDALKIFGLGYSWGGYESLAVPVFLGDRTIAKGPYEGPLIRLQIGLEDVADLKADIERGLAAAAGA